MTEASKKTPAKRPAKRATPAKTTTAAKGAAPIVSKEGCEPCDSLSVAFSRQLRYDLTRDDQSRSGMFHALAIAVKEQLLDNWRNTRKLDIEQDKKHVSYLSLEFLMGRALGNALLNMNMTDESRQVLSDYAVSLEELEQQEHDAGLGNGGLGRLAACFLDSCATLDLAVTGYGIRYEYGMFLQKIVDGYQVEQPDRWLRDGNPWEVRVPQHNVTVKFFGHTHSYTDASGRCHMLWSDTQDVAAVAYDMPVPGYRNGRVNTLRLWKAEATNEFDLAEFNQGDYTEAVAAKNLAEQITMVLYPNDSSENGKELRLRQQYFLSSASLQDLLRNWVLHHGMDFSEFAKLNAIQLNDTHPAIAVPELMRLLVDVYEMDWDPAWEIVTNCMAYTNHTLLPEALERWPVRMFKYMLPRIMEIIYEINARYLDEVAHRWPGNTEKLRAMSIIEEGPEPHVRMAYLAIVASYSVNGVAALHTELLMSGLFRDFYELWPHKFNNRTNGVTPRRWMAYCNPKLSALITSKLGDDWVTDLTQLEGLKKFAEDKTFADKWYKVKQENKAALAALVADRCNVDFDTSMMFDVQVKRIHEYKRQFLNILHVIHLYQRIINGDTQGMQPRCVLIGGKAAPGYAIAKTIIKLANNVAHMINCDPKVNKWLRFAFLPDYNVSAMETICPGTDLSEQISTAGKEASGTGNMKFMMNGALTIGTLDGANIEMLEQVGEENFFLFGLNAKQVEELRQHYRPWEYIAASEALSGVMSLLKSGHFNLQEPGIFDPLVMAIESPTDPWMLAADFEAFRIAQLDAANAYQDRQRWTAMSIRNTAASGRFSSDFTIAGYRDNIWNAH